LLDQTAIILQEHPQTSLTLQGHTDKRGGNAYNMKLAKQRALNAKQYLVDAGIEAERMKVVAYGKAKPAVPPAGRKGQAFNRRVEFMLLSNQFMIVPQYRDLQPKQTSQRKKLIKK
jgi:OmpA-OmpF porin, OOP family